MHGPAFWVHCGADVLYQDVVLLCCGRQQCLKCAIALPLFISTLSSCLSRPMAVLKALRSCQAQGVGMRGLLLRDPLIKCKSGWQHLSITNEV